MKISSICRNRYALALGATLLVGPAFAAACSDDAGLNLTVTTLTVVSGSGQSAVAGLALAAPLVVKATNSDGDPVEGAVIVFTTTGGGSLSNETTTTDADGLAHTSYTLGVTLGAQVVTAAVSGQDVETTFTVTAVVATNPQITVVSGNGQTAVHGTQLPLPLVVVVKDASGTPLPGITINWNTTAGTLSSASTVTGANGQTQVTLTLPATPGGNTISATINGTSTAVTFLATGS